jgi:spore germination cell wall hydrolase CwlJ-like protein
VAGRVAVANVVLNRVAKNKPGRFGRTVEAVCRKKAQFSCWNAGDVNLPQLLAVTDSNAVFRECLEIARDGVNGDLSDNTLGSDHYHVEGVGASWAKGRTPAVVIGHHLFYNNIP